MDALEHNAYLIDVRSSKEYAIGSAEGAVNISVNQLTKNLKKLRIKKSIVVFCRSGHRAKSAKAILEQNGVKNVINGGSLFHVQKVQKRVKKH